MADVKIKMFINQKIEVINHNKKYNCRIQDIKENHFLIDAPFLLLHDYDLEFIISSDDEVFVCNSKIIGHKKENDINLSIVSMPYSVIKIQRREYYRLTIAKPIKYSLLPFRKSYKSIDDIPIEVFSKLKTSVTIDISGGGVKIITDENIAADRYVILEIDIGEIVDLLAVSIRCEKDENSKKYRVSLKYVKLDNKTRDKIIKYIFMKSRELIKANK